MNKVILSGKVSELVEIDGSVGMFVLQVDQNHYFYVYYEKHLYGDLEIKGEKVGIIGTLEYIKVRLPEQERVKRLIAIRLEDLEIVNDV